MTANTPATHSEHDPVCGMNVNPATAKHIVEHGGKNYYFCCAGCSDKFMANPQQFLNKPTGLQTLGMPPAAKPQVSLERDPVCGMNAAPVPKSEGRGPRSE